MFSASLETLLAVPLSGMLLLVICAFAWARRCRSWAWYAFASGFLLWFLSKIPFYYQILFESSASVISASRSTLLFYNLLTLAGNIGIWISAVSLLVILLRPQK